MINQLKHVFHSTIKSLEILYVLEGAKPCARIMVFEDELGNAKEFLDKNDIFSSISDFKALKQNSQSEYYSDRSIKIPKNDARKGYYFIYFSKDKKTHEEAKITEEKNSHAELGMLLGYPKCCSEFFEKHFSYKNTDLTLKSLENSEGIEFPFYTNIAARHFDAGLLSHFPHSFECGQSLDIARKNFEIVQNQSPKLAQILTGIMQKAVVYTMQEGIFLLKSHGRLGSKLTYGDILSTAKSKLYYLLSSNRELEILSKNSFIVEDERIQGKDYGIMTFI